MIRLDRVKGDQVRYDRVKKDWVRSYRVRNDRVRYDRIRNYRGLEMIVNPIFPISKQHCLFKGVNFFPMHINRRLSFKYTLVSFTLFCFSRLQSLYEA